MATTITRRGALGLFGAAAVGVGLAACGSSGGSSAGSKHLNMFNYDTPDQAKLTNQVLAAFTKADGISVKLDTLPGSGAAIYPGKLRTEILGGSAPDVFRCWGGTIAKPFVDTHQVVDLGPAYDKYGWASKLAAPNINDFTYNNVKYGLPLYASAVGVWYSTSAYSKAGISGPPTTFAEMESANAALVKAGVQPWLAGGKFGWYVMRFFEWFLEMTAGPDEHDKLRNGQTNWNTSSVVDAFGILQKWAQNKWLPPGVMGLDPTQVEAEFAGNKGAMALDGQWIEQTLVAQKIPVSGYGTYIPPTDQSNLRFSGFTEGLFVTTQSKNQDNAEKLLDFVASVSSQETLQNAYTTVKAVPDTPGFVGTAQWKKWLQSNQHYVIQDQSLTTDQANAYFSIQSDVVQGNQTPASAAAAMGKAVPVSQ